MNFKVFIIVAFCLVGCAVAEHDYAKEKEALSKIFDPEAAPLEPEETLRYLRDLEEMYENDTESSIDQNEQGRRLVVSSCVSFGDVNEDSCTQQRFNDFSYLGKHLASYPNMNKFVSHYQAEQMALCKKVNPNFSVDTAEVDE